MECRGNLQESESGMEAGLLTRQDGRRLWSERTSSIKNGMGKGKGVSFLETCGGGTVKASRGGQLSMRGLRRKAAGEYAVGMEFPLA